MTFRSKKQEWLDYDARAARSIDDSFDSNMDLIPVAMPIEAQPIKQEVYGPMLSDVDLQPVADKYKTDLERVRAIHKLRTHSVPMPHGALLSTSTTSGPSTHATTFGAAAQSTTIRTSTRCATTLRTRSKSKSKWCRPTSRWTPSMCSTRRWSTETAVCVVGGGGWCIP